MTPARLRILTDGLTALAQVIISARSDRDAESIVRQIRSWGEPRRADVDAVEAERLRELRADEPTRPLATSPTAVSTGRLYRAPDPGGPLDDGD